MKLYVYAIFAIACVQTVGATVTAYCACHKCCGKWSAAGVTARGTKPRTGFTAAGPRNIRLGTRVYIEGIGVRVIEDRTARRFDGTWEIFFHKHSEALRFGRQQRKITILK